MLTQWATDAYYKVVITKNQGIPTICQAMQVYITNNQSIQRSGCTALLLLAASQQPAIQRAGGVSLAIAALRNHQLCGI
jgi:hypothetical protein